MLRGSTVRNIGLQAVARTDLHFTKSFARRAFFPYMYSYAKTEVCRFACCEPADELAYASEAVTCIRMKIKRKSHNLDEDLLRRARKVLGTNTETETIHEALRGVLVGEALMADLEAVRGRVDFRPEFVRQMHRERKSRQ